MSDFTLKTYDSLPVITSYLSNDDGYFDLSNSTVLFIYQTKDGSSAAVSRSATILSATGGYVQYTWTTGDTYLPGVYYGEWRITTTGGKQITFPNDSYFVFSLENKLS